MEKFNLYNENGQVQDPEIAMEMAKAEDPYHKKRFGIFSASKKKIAEGEKAAEEVGQKLWEEKESKLIAAAKEKEEEERKIKEKEEEKMKAEENKKEVVVESEEEKNFKKELSECVASKDNSIILDFLKKTKAERTFSEFKLPRMLESVLPKELRDDRKLMLDIYQLFDSEKFCSIFSDELKNDYDFMLPIVSKKSNALYNTGKKLLGNKDFILAAIKANVYVANDGIKIASKEVRDNEEVRAAALKRSQHPETTLRHLEKGIGS